MDDVVMIVGGGPAGISTWLHLQKDAPRLAERSIVIEKAAFPRDKLCAGGLCIWGADVLASLEVDLDDIPSLFVSDLELRFGKEIRLLHRDNCFRVVQRSDGDILSQPNVVLVGDAAGVERAFGGGIHLALSYGEVAAQAIVNASHNEDFSFRDYQQRIQSNPMGKFIAKCTDLALAMHDGRMNLFMKRRPIKGEMVKTNRCSVGFKQGDALYFNIGVMLISRKAPVAICPHAIAALSPVFYACLDRLSRGVNPKDIVIDHVSCTDPGSNHKGLGNNPMRITFEPMPISQRLSNTWSALPYMFHRSSDARGPDPGGLPKSESVGAPVWAIGLTSGQRPMGKASESAVNFLTKCPLTQKGAVDVPAIR